MTDERAFANPAAEPVSVDDLARRYTSVLIRYFGRRGIEAGDAQDLAQEVFEQLSRPEVQARVERVDGYMFSVAANLAIDYFRRRRVRLAHQAGDHLDSLHRAEDFPADRILEGREELALIVAALNQLPERMRHVFILARLENMSRAEIATRLGVSKSTVEKQLNLATACLADSRRRAT